MQWQTYRLQSPKYGVWLQEDQYFNLNRIYKMTKKIIQGHWQQAFYYNTQQPPFYGHYTGQPKLAGTSS